MKKLQLWKPMLLACCLLLSAFSFSQVTEQWAKRYNGSGNDVDRAQTLAVDASGNVYVTGYSFGNGTDYDITTVKYTSNGAELWVRKYNGPASSSDFPNALRIDDFGNIYVTGGSYGDGSSLDYVTIKYDTDGAELWVKRYDSNGDDYTTSLAVDGFGNVYVTGGSYYDYATLKYDAAGNELWVRRYDGLGNGYDEAASLAVDGLGNVYVTGFSVGNGSNTGGYPDYDYATVKYDAAGNEVWVRRYNGPGKGSDIATSLAIDATGNIYITGGSLSAKDDYNYDYATIKYTADGTELWVSRYIGPDDSDFDAFDQANSIATDNFGNVYVTGQSFSSKSGLDYATIKYDTAGVERWAKRHAGFERSHDAAISLALDTSGNVYVTGESSGDYATLKYDAAGDELWLATYNGQIGSYDTPDDLAVDDLGNVYVTGTTNADYATIKYSQTGAGSVSSFNLIDADTDEAIRELKDGDTLNLVTLASLNLNLRATTTPAVVGSVVFNLSGAETRNHTENIVPYALFADNKKGDYYSWTPSNGNYTLTATPYSATKGKGEKGTALTIHFTVVGTAVSNLILVNAETDQDIKTLQNGDAIDLASLPTDKLNIRAVVHPDTVGSVLFNLNNRIIVRENLAPYAIGGDIKGDYRAWTLPTGQHTLTATPYDGKYGRGKKGKAHNVSFTVVDMSATTHAGNLKKPIPDAQYNGQTLKATPNPFSAQTTVHFSVPQPDYTTVQVCDLKGTVVALLYQAWAEGGKEHRIPFDSKQLSSGVYVLRLTTGKQVQFCKLVLIR